MMQMRQAVAAYDLEGGATFPSTPMHILPVVDLGFAVREACAPQDDWALQFVREL
jgi:hypothetical protein